MARVLNLCTNINKIRQSVSDKCVKGRVVLPSVLNCLLSHKGQTYFYLQHASDYCVSAISIIILWPLLYLHSVLFPGMIR
jgi:hypothetical protein